MRAISELHIIHNVNVATVYFDVIHKGDFLKVFAHIFYDRDELRIDNPVARQQHTSPFSEYSEVEGMNLQEFIMHKCNEILENPS